MKRRRHSFTPQHRQLAFSMVRLLADGVHGDQIVLESCQESCPDCMVLGCCVMRPAEGSVTDLHDSRRLQQHRFAKRVIRRSAGLTPSSCHSPPQCVRRSWLTQALNLALCAVSGHSVSDECLQRQFQESRRFFELPLAEKLRLRVRRLNVVGLLTMHDTALGAIGMHTLSCDRSLSVHWIYSKCDSPYGRKDGAPCYAKLPLRQHLYKHKMSMSLTVHPGGHQQPWVPPVRDRHREEPVPAVGPEGGVERVPGLGGRRCGHALPRPQPLAGRGAAARLPPRHDRVLPRHERRRRQVLACAQRRELRSLSRTACCCGTQCCSMSTASWEA